MYMLVFVTLMVTVMGAYTQLAALQAGKMSSQQTGAVDAMLAWHTTAVSLAEFFVKQSSIVTGNGCSLTSPGPGGLSTCTKSGGGSSMFVTAGGAPPCSGTQGAPCYTALPTGYATSSYAFYSVAFQNAGQYYVLTYVPPPSAGSDAYGLGLLCLPGTAGSTVCPPSQQLPITFDSLYKQMGKNLRLSSVYYGTVTSANTLTTPTVSFDKGAAGIVPQSLSFTVPGTGTVPLNSLGIITQITPCPTTFCG
ncbi:MAG: hypothetical protein P4M13_00250 [Alphaproteobacteria bacterium]|nr:hypothetical protein [Alphaproteobacteria bacterium]